MSEQPTPKPCSDIDALMLIIYMEAWTHRVMPDMRLDQVSRLATVAKTMRDIEGLQSRIIDVFANISSVDLSKTKSHLKLVFSADKPKADE